MVGIGELPTRINPASTVRGDLAPLPRKLLPSAAAYSGRIASSTEAVAARALSGGVAVGFGPERHQFGGGSASMGVPSLIGRPSGGATESVDAQRAQHRSIEWSWRLANRELLERRYSGEWVVLEGEMIISHGRDVGHVLAEARRSGVAVPYLFLVRPALSDSSFIGL